MNLTQKQLSALAKVSTPTISRFEQNAKDVQLSTVLGILDVLGMTDNRTVTFSDEGPYPVQIGVENGLMFWGLEGEKRIKCQIENIALEDWYSDNERLSVTAAFKKYHADIEALARKKYLLGQLEPDRSVFIRTEDVRR
jgi:transcriptional regulator with XRE-family HTH domain